MISINDCLKTWISEGAAKESGCSWCKFLCDNILRSGMSWCPLLHYQCYLQPHELFPFVLSFLEKGFIMFKLIMYYLLQYITRPFSWNMLNFEANGYICQGGDNTESVWEDISSSHFCEYSHTDICINMSFHFLLLLHLISRFWEDTLYKSIDIYQSII